jgi:hypothetical protein
MVKVVNLQGKLKSSKRQASELHFDFSINCIGKFFSSANRDLTCFFMFVILIFFSIFIIIGTGTGLFSQYLLKGHYGTSLNIQMVYVVISFCSKL